MRAVLESLAALLLSAFVLTIGHGLALLVMPLRAELIGFSAPEISLTGSAYYLGFVLGCFVVPGLIARVGHLRVYAVFGAVLIAVFLLVHLAQSLVLWTLLRFATGVLMAGQFMVIETWLNERATTTTRGRVLAIYVLVTLAANTLGQLLVNVAPIDSEALFILAAILVASSIVPLGLSLAALPASGGGTAVRLGLLWRVAPIAFVGAAASGFVTGASGAMNAVFARSVGLEVLAVSIYTSAVIAGGAVFQYPIGRLADRLDRRHALIGLFIGVVLASCAAILVIGIDTAWLPVIGFLWGGAGHCIYASALAHANDRTPPGEIVGIGGAILVMWGIGAIIGPLGASGFMHWFGPGGYFGWMIAAATAALLVALALRLRDHGSTPDAVRGGPSS